MKNLLLGCMFIVMITKSFAWDHLHTNASITGLWHLLLLSCQLSYFHNALIYKAFR